MKKLAAFVLVSVLAGSTVPAFADAGLTGEDQMKNINTGSRNVGTGWVEVLDATHEEAAKGKGTAEQLTGVAAGGVVGVTRAAHRIGGGAIDLLTFWIPKKQPLVNPEKARLQ